MSEMPRHPITRHQWRRNFWTFYYANTTVTQLYTLQVSKPTSKIECQHEATRQSVSTDIRYDVNKDVLATRYCLLSDVTIAGLPRCPVWCQLVTVPTDPFTTFTTQTGPFLSEWAKCQPGNSQNSRTVLPTTNVMADFETQFPSNHMSYLV